MVAMDDRQRTDAAADPGIGRARFQSLGAATVDVKQRRDHLQVVLHPVMDFPHQPALPLERAARLAFGFLDACDGAGEGVAKLLDLLARTEPSGQLERALAGAIGANRLL